LLQVVAKLFQLSRAESAGARDGNMSQFVYAALPLLPASVWSFAIEYEGIHYLASSLPAELTGPSLTALMETYYRITGDLLEDCRDLMEIRNEIIHPVPLPTGTPDNWPDYLRRVKSKGLLSTSGSPNSDYVMFGQIASHKLFVWALDVTKNLYAAIIESNPTKARMFRPFLGNFQVLLGDLLLEENQPGQALAAYEASLQFAPNRFNSLSGAGRAAELAGARSKAETYYRQLLIMCKNTESERPELHSAKSFLEKQARLGP